MRTKNISYDVYTIEELKKEHPGAFEKAHQEYCTNGFDYEWYDAVYDDAKKAAKIMGIDIAKIYFTGFWCQGDGACFEGSYRYAKGAPKAIREYAPQENELHRIAEALQSIQRDNFYKLSATVKHSGHYYHAYCTNINVERDSYDYREPAPGSEESLTELLRDFMKWIYRRLESEYEYLTSEESFIETSQCKEWEYTQSGKLA